MDEADGRTRVDDVEVVGSMKKQDHHGRASQEDKNMNGESPDNKIQTFGLGGLRLNQWLYKK